MSNETRQLAEFVAEASPENLPGHLYDCAKDCILDTLGVVLFGTTQPWSEMIASYGRRMAAGATQSSATIIAKDWKAPPGIASLVNGAAGHAFELDDVHDESLLHPGTVVVPAALAVGEDVKVTGQELMTAVIVGYELMVRAGLGVGAVSHMLGGFHSTGTNGVFGAAATAAKLLRLDAPRTVHSLGVAGSMAGGLMEFSQTGGMVKRIHAGRAAESGIIAAYLAAEGFTGPSSVLEGEYGFCKVFSSDPEPERLLRRPEGAYAIEETTRKPYACCSDLHAGIDCIADIRRKADVDPEKVARIVIHCYEKLVRQNTLDGTASIMAAQYSITFTIAAAFYYDMSDPRVYRADVIADPRIARLAERVEVRVDPEFDAIYPRKMPTRIEVEMADGRMLTAQVIGAKGHFENPMSAGDLEAKFRNLAEGILSPRQVDDAITAVAELNRADSLRDLLACVVPAPMGGRERRAKA